MHCSVRNPSPPGTWPLRFDALVQPVLDQHCVQCHGPDAADPRVAAIDLRPNKAWNTLMRFGENDLRNLVFERDQSIPGESPARQSKLITVLTSDDRHKDINLTKEDLQRVITWIDTYGQTQGAFSTEQEHQIETLRRQQQTTQQ